MEKREPSLVPEWRRTTGNSSGVGSKNHIQSSSARSDSSVSHNSKSRNSRTKVDVDSVRSPFLDRSSSTDAPRRFSNRSTRNAYRNFNVQRRVRGKDRRMEKPTYIDPLGHDFPCLKTQERNEGGPDVVRISSPGLSHAVQSLSVGDSGLTAREGWTPAPAKVPNVIEKSGSNSVVNVGTWIPLTGQTRNMAEALLQAPRTDTLPQESLMIQRLEDRALKLIPVLPSAPKHSVSKDKPMVRSGATGLASFRNTHQSLMLQGNLHSNYGRQIKPDNTKKLVILKPTVKESGSSSRITNSLAAGSQKIAAPSATSGAQTQSRNAFYSALKKKTSTNISTSSCIFSSVEEKTDISKEVVATGTSSVHAVERDGIVMERVEKVSEAAERVSVFESTDLPDEKEAEFLKSLGWDENNTEVEALTDEEIRAFYEQHKTLKPSLMKELQIITEATEEITPNS